eukprot:790447-Rhodomonas_salina.1
MERIESAALLQMRGWKWSEGKTRNGFGWKQEALSCFEGWGKGLREGVWRWVVRGAEDRSFTGTRDVEGVRPREQ